MLPCRRFLALAASAATIALVALAPACSKSSNSRPTPSARTADGTPAPTPTPKPPPADPKLADRLRAEGDYERAIEVYAAVAADRQGDGRQQALLSQAELLTRTARPADARPVLEEYLQGAGAAADGSSAQYMLASTLDDLGDAQGALDAYERYIAAGGAAADFARVERAKMLAKLNRPADAEQAAAEVLASGLADEFKQSFVFSMATAFERAGADQDALAWYARVIQDPNGDVASALARTGAIKKRLGDASWSADYLRVVTDYPSSGPAADLLDELDQAAVPVRDEARGVVLYRAGRNDDARAALQRAVAAGDDPGEALFYFAALDERAQDFDSAIQRYGQSQQTDPASPVAADALWWRGWLLERQQRWQDAGAAYGALAEQYPSSSRAADARFRAVLVRDRSGDRAGAAAAWLALAQQSSADDATRARYFAGRAQLSFDAAAGRATLQSLIDEQPVSFYGLRAQVLLGKNDDRTHDPKLEDEHTDWKPIASYVQEQTGTDPEAAPAAALQDPRWALGAELAAVQLPSQSDSIYRDIIFDHREDPVALYAIAKRFDDEGRVGLAARAATRLIGALPPHAPDPPEALLRVAYPAAFPDLVNDAAKAQKVPPLLLLALVRQESFFDPDAGSTAGALGLTQVVPSTGETIAQRLGRAPFAATDLYRPKVSLDFGANELAQQLASFGDDPYRALAAYNGGPGAAANAQKTAGDDDDLFVEDLEFGETRSYVQLVMENYARYRALYEGIDAPSLPQ